MAFLKRHTAHIAEAVYLTVIYFISQLPLRDFDIWFHLKSGELFVNQKSLQFAEVFSYTAQGRNWTPFEWLFQIIVYLLARRWGLVIIPFFISIFVVISHFFFLRILDYIFKVKLIPRLILGFIFFVSTYEFNSARPHVLAYTFLIMTVFLILARIFKNKKWLYFSPLLTIIWTNLHSTGFLSWGLTAAFSLIVFFQWLAGKKKESLKIVRDLAILTVINFLITISPPMMLRDYQLLWHFLREREFLGHFIAEWSPTYEADNLIGIYIYSAFLAISGLVFLFLTLVKKAYLKNLWALPFILMGLVGYTATRNVFIGMFGMLVVLGSSIQYFQDRLDRSHSRSKRLQTVVWIILAVAMIGFQSRLFMEKRALMASERRYYPVQSTEFAKRYLKGRMFNDYTYGGYILYSVYPKLRVFIDGRADVYLCCEMQDYLLLAVNKRMDDENYRQFLNLFWDEYEINFAIISTQKHNVMRRIAKMLNTDPNWALVFWDDDSQVFVKRDGINNEIIGQLEAKYATPYLKDPYPEGKLAEALKEYQRMDSIAKSARTFNAIGFILLQQGQFEQAKQYFLEANNQDPTFESPYMNLAELAAKDGNTDMAIKLYTRAQRLADDRGLIYIRLGQLILEQTGDKARVKKIWENGIKKTVEDEAREELKEFISTL